jgi:hypothetical protein
MSEKRNGFVVVREAGPGTVKIVVPPDSVWGYVSGNGHAFRFYRGEEYRIEQADTLTIYSSNTVPANSEQTGNWGAPLANRTYAAKHYYFSRGITGIPFPLTVKNIQHAYEASNPNFVASVQNMGLTQTLSDFDRKTGLFRVVKLYRDALN